VTESSAQFKAPSSPIWCSSGQWGQGICCCWFCGWLQSGLDKFQPNQLAVCNRC